MQITPQNYDFNADFQAETYASKTYKINLEEKRIIGKVDGLEEVKQAVYKILHTERFSCLIYSWDYGVEFDQLIGKDYDFIVGDLQRRIEEALLQDDRIKAIEDVKISKQEKSSISVSFVVVSKFGNIPTEVSVDV